MQHDGIKLPRRVESFSSYSMRSLLYRASFEQHNIPFSGAWLADTERSRDQELGNPSAENRMTLYTQKLKCALVFPPSPERYAMHYLCSHTPGQHVTPRLLCLHEGVLHKSLNETPPYQPWPSWNRSLYTISERTVLTTCLLTAIRIIKFMRGTICGLAAQSADPCFAQHDPWIVQIHALRLTYACILPLK